MDLIARHVWQPTAQVVQKARCKIGTQLKAMGLNARCFNSVCSRRSSVDAGAGAGGAANLVL